MKMIHIMVGGPIYRFHGKIFEMHRYCGPSELRKNDLELKKKPQTMAFLNAIDGFMELSDSDRKKYLEKE